MIIALAVVACLAALAAGGVFLFMGWTAAQSPGSDSLILGLIIALVGLADLAVAGLGAWRAFAGVGGLWPALISLGLSALMARVAGGLAHGIANP